MASTDDIYGILIEVKGQLGEHSERFNSIDNKLTPIIEKVEKHDKAIIGVAAIGSFLAVLGGLFIGGVKAGIAGIVSHNGG